MYRMWSDGSIDVRINNPLASGPQDRTDSDKGDLSKQEGWRALQFGE